MAFLTQLEIIEIESLMTQSALNAIPQSSVLSFLMVLAFTGAERPGHGRTVGLGGNFKHLADAVNN